MNTRRTYRWIACLALFAAGCSDEPPASSQDDPSATREPGAVIVTIDASADTLVQGETIDWTIAVENRTDEAVEAGAGSGGCRLHAEVMAGDTTMPLAEERMCTMDYVQYVLQPGEVREETWSWSGAVRDEKGVRTLEPGTYRVKGVAGPYRSATHDVVIVAP